MNHINRNSILMQNGELSGWKKWNGTAFSRNSLVEDMEPLRNKYHNLIHNFLIL